FNSGTFPSLFKVARVTPLLKKPSLDPTQVENYRPVSLLTLLSKTIEKGRFQTGHRVPVKEQSPRSEPVWIQKRSLHRNSPVVCMEALKTARAAAESSALVLLDLSVAFDTVNHRILLSILSSMGISGNAHSWFESYLTGRSFNVSWQGQLSVPHRLTTGVPQGSVMGPLLFAIYT